ncbi:MAG: DNA-binding protein [Dehalococcoidia bacterium]|nr:DNA-binding protein [Dehalococcoidia bacterium]
MRVFALRLRPGQDLRRELVAFAAQRDIRAGVVLTCVGSLRRAALRMAAQAETTILEDAFEIVSLVGTLSPEGPHLHLAVSDGAGRMVGGHLQDGAIVRTTAEIAIADLAEYAFTRPVDPETGYDELLVSPRQRSDA